MMTEKYRVLAISNLFFVGLYGDVVVNTNYLWKKGWCRESKVRERERAVTL